jgi:hypothetical protein
MEMTRYGAALLPLLLALMANPIGNLQISQLVKSNNAITITSTCVQGAGPVSIFFTNMATGVHFKVHGGSGNCSLTAATTGRAVAIPVDSVPAGTYRAMLKQGSSVSAPSAAFSLP